MAAATLLLVTLCFGVSAVHSLHVDRQALQALADGAALAGADTLDVRDVRLGDAPTTDTAAVDALDVETILRAAERFIEAASPDTTITAVRVADGNTAVVELSSAWVPPWFGDVLGSAIHITSEGRARVVIY